MKKFYMILAAIAAMTMTAQAQNWATIDVGDWDNATTYNGSYFDMAPTTFYVAHTGVQMLYTPDMLADMDGKQNVRIKGLTFMFHDETFEDIARNVKIYVLETDATEFAVNEEGVKQFFPFGEQVWEEDRVYEMLYSYGEDYTTAFRFDCPFTPGKSLLVTMVFDAFDDDNCTMGSDYAPFYTSGIRSKAMTYTNNGTSFVDYAVSPDFPDATAVLGCGTNVDLPLTRIQYTYEEGTEPTEKTGAPVFNGYTTDGIHAYFVEINPTDEGSVIYYRILYPGEEEYTEWAVYNERLSFEGDGKHRVEAYAVAPGKLPSEQIAYEFVVEPEPPTAISEMMNGKTVAGVRYFNLAGQEMTEANGLTIMVTTYTDGTTSAVKVVK